MEKVKRDIERLKRERRAIILAHNYQIPEVQDVADFLGDSLGLSLKAAQTDAKVIVFCGVHFMAETAAIVCPDKLVIMPDITAGCPMAAMVDAERLRRAKEEHPEAVVVSYVNTTAEVKAESDICCTSANSVEVVREVLSKDGDRPILFVPDKFLGSWTEEQVGRKFILWDGHCHVHVRILREHVEEKKRQHPDAVVMVHPECRPEVRELADYILSTGGMVKLPQKVEAKKFIVGTEVGIIYRLKRLYPDREFIPATELAVCPNMKKTTLEKVLWALEELREPVEVPPDIAERARRAIERMLSIPRRR